MPIAAAAHHSVRLIRILGREARLAAGLHGGLADLLGRLGGGLTDLLDRFFGGLPNLLGCLLGRLSSTTTGEAPNRLLGDVAHLGGAANHSATFAIFILRG